MDEQLIAIFCEVDDFCNDFLPTWHVWLKNNSLKHRLRTDCLCLSEMMTIAIMFHLSGMRTFKAYHQHISTSNWRSYFPRLPSYHRTIQMLKNSAIPMDLFLRSRKIEVTDFLCVDSTPLEACHIMRAKRNRIFKGIAAKAKTSTGWFYGMKLHLLANTKGEIVSYAITSGNVDDRSMVPALMNGIQGKVIGDMGYISDELEFELAERGIKLITRTRTNMSYERVLSAAEQRHLRKRGFIETINDQLKNIFHISHTRYRSVESFFVNVLSGLAAYWFKPKKPSIA